MPVHLLSDRDFSLIFSNSVGTHITDDLKWDKNTEEIVKSAWKRMQLLCKTASFTSNVIY